MIITDPFKTKSDAIKTLLTMRNDDSILSLLYRLNPCLTSYEMRQYFNDLHSRFPDEFSTRSHKTYVTLSFMNHSVITFNATPGLHQGASPLQFIEYWKTLF